MSKDRIPSAFDKAEAGESVNSKADYAGSVHEVKDGDVVMYYTNKSIADVYRSNGVY